MLHTSRDAFHKFAKISEPILDLNKTFKTQSSMRHKNGSIIETEITVTPLLPKAGWQAGVVSIVNDITQQERAKELLEKSEEHYRLLAENTLDVIWYLDINLIFTYVNKAVEKLTGYSPQEFIGTRLEDHFQREEGNQLLEIAKSQLTAGPEQDSVMQETKLLHKNGSLVPIEFHSTALYENGSPIGLQGTARDIRERKAAEQALHASEEKYRITTENLSELIYRTDPSTMATTYVNKAVESIYGYTVQEWLADPKLWLKTLHEEDKEEVISKFQTALDQKRGLKIEYRILCRNGQVRWVVDKVDPKFDEQGRIVSLIGVMDDITDRKKQEEQLRHQAYHDLLTGLGNRNLLLESIDEVKQRAKDRGSQVAMLFLDLDDFKLINDSMGHSFGDWILQKFAQRLLEIKPKDTVAVRYGGDEFVLLTDVTGAQEVFNICKELRNHLAEPFYHNDYEFFISTSIGIGLSRSTETIGLELLREADTALYEAKKIGKGHHLIFDNSMRSLASERLRILGDMHRALDRDEFFLVFQPIVSLETLTIIGFEALVRWKHPEQGLIPPSDFIPVAEDSGLISRIGLQVMDKACRQAKKWALDRPNNQPFVSFNVSTKQLHQTDLIKSLDSLIQELKLSPAHIKIEITESSLMEDIDLSLNILFQLHEMGVTLQIDDFGTGYSSLKYLQRIPAGNLKVDRTFVSNLERDDEKKAIIKTIENLAHSLGMGVVAEGIETKAQLSILRDMGVGYGQGYLFDKPLYPEDAGNRWSYSNRNLQSEI
jgi:diguanylate cyclase (GGDEF)-like protein/PAS domain S-box-containing protein